MRLKLIACKVMQREIGALAAVSQNYIDITYIRQGFHNEPARLREILQHEIDTVESSDDPHSCGGEQRTYDAILLCYGLCSNGICGLRSRRHRLVIPRAHDCITLLLGSKEAYNREFSYAGGTYFYTAGWIENASDGEKDSDYNKKYLEYSELYGEENAQYLMEQESSWNKNYKRLCYIDWPESGFPDYTEYIRKKAAGYGLDFERAAGDAGLLSAFLSGDWDDERFIVLEPGETSAQSYDAGVIKKA